MYPTKERWKELGLEVAFYDEQINHVPVENASRWYAYEVGNLGNMANGKMPKRLNNLEDHICRNFVKKTTSVYSSLQPLFAKLDLRHLNAYATTYGVGVEVLFKKRDKVEEEVLAISDVLVEHGITFRNEYSPEHWVYRFVIHRNAANLERVRAAAK